jgi:hypothetical protein
MDLQSGFLMAKFTGKHVHRSISRGIGGNLPQEVPKAFQGLIDRARS